jgi:hypothetical protein
MLALVDESSLRKYLEDVAQATLPAHAGHLQMRPAEAESGARPATEHQPQLDCIAPAQHRNQNRSSAISSICAKDTFSEDASPEWRSWSSGCRAQDADKLRLAIGS